MSTVAARLNLNDVYLEVPQLEIAWMNLKETLKKYQEANAFYNDRR